MITVLIGQIFVTLFLGFSVFLFVWSLFRYPVPSEPPIHRRIATALGAEKPPTLFEHPVLAPLLAMAMAAARRFSLPAIRDRIRQDLNAAGNPNNYSIDEYISICLFSGVTVAAAALVVIGLYLGDVEPITPVVMGLLAFGVPIWILHEQANRRVSRISKQLPYTLDLIALMMAAGATFTEAIETLIRDNPEEDFNLELRFVQAEIEFGTPRNQAMANMAERIPLESLRSVVGAINQAEALGTPLSVILKTQSGMMRMHRSVRAEKLSASASLRILVPSMLILAAVVVIVFGPLLMNWAASGFKNFFGS